MILDELKTLSGDPVGDRELTVADLLTVARLIRDRYQDPIALEMSRESYRRMIADLNIPTSEEPRRLFGMPILFDDTIPTGHVREKFPEGREPEIKCPHCNPEGRPRIRRLNRLSICLVCFNTGWTKANKICRCGQPSGIYVACDECSQKAKEALRSQIKLT